MKKIAVLLYFLMLISASLSAEEQNPPVLLEFCGTAKENSPSLSSDGLTLFYHSETIEGYGGEDIWYVVRKSTLDNWSKPINIGKQINTQYHEWAPNISRDGLSLYFASNRPGGLGGYDLWISVRTTINDEWSNPRNLGDTINSTADEANPCISKNELYLVFSDYREGILRKEGLGQADLWFSERVSKDATWGVPSNLGAVVNSERIEIYPRLAMNDSILLFSTNRDGGYGDRDIWYSKRDHTYGEWQRPINLGSVINSRYIEVGLIISDDGNEAFFASNRNSGGASLDIYYVNISKFLEVMIGLESIYR